MAGLSYRGYARDDRPVSSAYNGVVGVAVGRIRHDLLKVVGGYGLGVIVACSVHYSLVLYRLVLYFMVSYPIR